MSVSTLESAQVLGDIRAIAFYLPQFHPIPENDEWWGKGFTEWTNVAKARPLFNGHRQPQLPADLGFYDLRLPETREAQAALARSCGLHGFCYYHYWFKGRRLLERPFQEVLGSGRPDYPFCLCWANETWSRRWLGEERSILLKQEYSDQDDVEHARALLGAFSDARYIRVNGRPLFMIYRPKDLPDPRRTTDTFRRVCVHAGLPEPFLIGANAHCPSADSRRLGFDHTLDFRPKLGVLVDGFNDEASARRLLRNLKRNVISARLKIYEYQDSVRLMQDSAPKYPAIPCVFVGWDNTPRRGDQAIVMVGSTPAAFERQLREEVARVRAQPNREHDKLIFINAWNEWAEGNAVEPSTLHRRGFLEAIRRVLADDRTPS